MAIKYKLITRKNPTQPKEAPKHYATIVRPENVTIEQLAKRVAEVSPVNELDTETTLIALSKIIPEFLASGATVELGKLGRLQVNLSSEGSKSEKDFNKEMIKACNLRFKPSVALSKAMKGIKYEKE